ncbi:MAG: long-chain fatty acid--CoA ligase [Candidatus Eremiobacteraeota bacterium]|nr:long-chain fatty acid--CoA ligase [Candidatus Eremiobacteraeota bacterium]
MASAFESSYNAEPVAKWAEQAAVKNIPELFRATVAKHPNERYLGEKKGDAYTYQTYKQVQEKVHHLACALLAVGLEPKDRVGLISNNRPEWVISDLGIMHAGCVNAPLYPTLSDDAIEYILKDSGARVVVAASEAHLRDILSVEKNLPALEHIVTIAPKGGSTSKKKLWDWDEFLEHGKANFDKFKDELEKRVSGIEATDVCSLVYTSGTTGDPKGAMLMHGNFVSNCTSVLPHIDVRPGDVELSFLPLSHVFERVVYYAMTGAGATIAYAESIDTVRDNLIEVRPHIVPSVPRLFEKIHAGILAKVHEDLNMKRRMFYWAIKVGKAYFDARVKGPVPGGLKLKYKLAYKLVLSKIHERTGGNIRLFVSGGAPLRADVGEFFLSAGFNLIEGYGLTETSPVITMNPPSYPKMGTVGKMISHVEVKIADDGEILTRGPHVMRGYFNKPDATKESINPDGWFHTGDIGEFDSEDYLRITDRKKEILVMSNGKNVAPQPIEQAMKSSKYIEQAVLIGDNRKFISALVVPSFEALQGWASENGVSTKPEEMVKDEKLVTLLMKECQRTCEEFSGYEQVKKIALLPKELSQDTGELTPTLKVKRRVVNQKYEEIIEGMYA